MMSSWLPANLFKSAPARRSRGGEKGRGGLTGSGARGAGRGSGARSRYPAPHPSCCPLCVFPGRGCPGMPRCHPGTPRRLWQRWHIARPLRSVNRLSSRVTRPALRLFGVGIYERYLHLAGSATCLSSNRLLPLPEETGWERGDVG